MRFALPGRAAKAVASVNGDLSRAPIELLQHVGAGAERQRIGPPGLLASMITVSSTKKVPVGVGVDGLPTTTEKLRVSWPL